jgi:NtrC-family two-component system sensor histidine kinase KinB
VVDLDDSRKQLESMAKQNRQFVEQVIAISPVPIIFIDKLGKITLANQQSESVFGIVKNEITLRTYNDPKWLMESIDGKPFPLKELPYERVKRTREPVFGVQHAIRWPDGRKVILSVNASPFFDVEGNFDGMIATIENITDKKRWEEIIKQENDRLKELDEIRQAFIVIASHELKTPVTNITGAIHVLETILDPATLKNTGNIMGILSRGSQRLQRLVMKLLDFSRAELKKIELDKQPIDLIPLVKGVIEELDYKIKESDHQVVLNIPPDCIVQADQLRIDEVIMNLVINAVKYTPRNGTITISIDSTPTHVKFAVSDNGVGLIAEDKKILFTKFGSLYRKQMEGKIETYGTGIGLFISKEIIDAHGGKIWAESAGRDKGSTFSFIIPKST